ncbi:tRNA pseudouridine(38-40) synthase TruA [Clostridium amazonitimonense]|uniref:tRNA pseudouridine(38-40) synthase TruA n=1 Tax=Clostridium amazonitimonense TaxID=1499689 RepID=UPI00050971E6|nr:tRNA pseudouridine(38-40) synthase TruA [Clostridium amazonitimonense]
MKNIKLVIEYDGYNYNGWQRQKNAITIQEKIEESIFKATGEEVSITGCSRTDTGVHARAFVANFYTSTTIPPEKIKYALNSKLPKDIVILNSKEVKADFHARYNCVEKTYSYTILNRDNPSALYRNYIYHVREKLDLNLMKEACNYFKGTHDFTAFKSTGSSVKTSTRTIKNMELHKDNDYIKIYVTADGFLYNMVRIIVGTLIEVGKGKLEPKSIANIIESRDRTKSGKVVPAAGLCLEKVLY